MLAGKLRGRTFISDRSCRHDLQSVDGYLRATVIDQLLVRIGDMRVSFVECARRLRQCLLLRGHVERQQLQSLPDTLCHLVQCNEQLSVHLSVGYPEDPTKQRLRVRAACRFSELFEHGQHPSMSAGANVFQHAMHRRCHRYQYDESE